MLDIFKPVIESHTHAQQIGRYNVVFWKAAWLGELLENVSDIRMMLWEAFPHILVLGSLTTIIFLDQWNQEILAIH